MTQARCERGSASLPSEGTNTLASHSDATNHPLDHAVEPHLWQIWAKWPRNGERRFHPLLCHMLDVAHVTRLMWSRALTAAQRARIAASLGLEESDSESWVVFCAGLHDLGKASPAFQTQLREKNPSDAQMIDTWLDEMGLNTRGARWAPHGAISLLLMMEFLEESPFGCGTELVRQIAAIVGAHHGLFFTARQLDEMSRQDLMGDDSWKPVQRALTNRLAAALGGLPERSPKGILANGDAMAIAGLISVADWIGSNTRRFNLAAPIPLPPGALDLSTYVSESMRHAQDSLADVFWDDINLMDSPREFRQLFPNIETLRDVQKSVVAIARDLEEPGLVIIEVPMGEGKTEAAMYLADHWSVQLGQRGIYFALPTQATSNQMFRRVRSFLHSRFGDEEYVNLHLAHGMAALSDEYRKLPIVPRLAEASLYDKDAKNEQRDAEYGAVIAAEWFATAKRTLLSAYGVGTIDQALLSVLQVKHGFVRLFGLGGKTVIVDEVHAYDVYMSTLLQSLLEWLGAMRTPVVLLSATLPATRRHALLSHYAQGAEWPVPTFEDAPYPRVTYVTAQKAGCEAITATVKARHLGLRWVDGSLPQEDDSGAGDSKDFPLAASLAEALREGGCAAVVCNTVRRAQAMYRALEASFAQVPPSERPDLHLFHAQFRHAQRQALEDFVLGAFGLDSDGKRNPNRPHRAVLVATQVIEQSLDLDFDVMVSDLAPVDLLLQRAGRVHRHEENEPRPTQLHEPTLWICRPGVDEERIPTFSRSDSFIYEPYILLNTWYALNQGQAAAVAIPGDIEKLINAVYTEELTVPNDVSAAFAARLQKTWREMKNPQLRAISQAQGVLIPSPWREDLYIQFNQQLEEDNPDAHASLQAKTRDGEPSLPVILLDADAPRLKRSAEPSLDDARKLLGDSINLSHAGLLRAIVDQEKVPSGWARTPWLRNYRAIRLDAEGNTHYRSVDGKRTYTLHLNPTLGVIITAQNGEGR